MVEDTLSRLREFLVNDGFAMSEEDAAFVVKIGEEKVEKVKNWSRFWSRKCPLRGKLDCALIIQGEIRAEEGGCFLDVELLEFHATRLHTYGGAPSISEYFEKICILFEEKSNL